MRLLDAQIFWIPHSETDVSHDHGNYDYLMACDLDMGEEQVRGELMYWGRWFVDTPASRLASQSIDWLTAKVR